jgi:hypothetical protein
MATEQDAIEDQGTDEDEGLKPGEVEVELGGEDEAEDEAASEVKAEPTPEEDRKTRQQRREEQASRRIADQVKAQLAEAKEKWRQEFLAESEQRFRPAQPEPKVESATADTGEVKTYRKQAERLLKLMRDPETSDEDVREMRAEYQDLQERIIGEIAKRSAPKVEKGEDPLAIQLQAEFPEFYQNPQLLAVAKQHGAAIAKPGMHPYVVARQSFLDVREALAKKRAQATSPEQASKYGTPSGTAGARESAGGGTRIVLTKNQRDLALATYSDQPKWSEEKKIKTWAQEQKKLGLL